MPKITNNIVFYIFIFCFIFLSILYYAEPFDESFISYRVAKYLKEGYGFRFNRVGEKVEGFSNFLWVVILSFVAKFKLNIVQSSTFICLWFAIGSIYLSFRLAKQLFVKLSLLVPLVIIFTDFFVVNSLNGLETSLFTFLLMLTAYCFIQYLTSPETLKQNIHLLLSSLASLLLSLTRPEGPIIFAVLCIYLIIEEHKNFRQQYKKFVFLVAPFSLLYLIYFAWRYNYFGYFLPNTYYARQLLLFPSFNKQFSSGSFYFFSFFSDQLHFLVILILLPLILKKGLKKEVKLLIAILFSYISFILLAGGDWNHMLGTWRFMVPLVPFLSLLLLNELLVLQEKTKYAAPIIVILCLALSQINLLDPQKYPDYLNFEMSRRKSIPVLLKEAAQRPHVIKYQLVNFLTNKGLSNLDGKTGLWIKSHYPPDTFLASQQEGRLAFFSDLQFLDIDGVVTEKIAHFSPQDYRREKHLDYIFKAAPDCLVFPVTVLKFEAPLFFSTYFKKHNYHLAKVFCSRHSFCIFDIYQKMYADSAYNPPDNVAFYLLFLFEKRKKQNIEKSKSIKLIFENEWYSIGEKDLIIF